MICTTQSVAGTRFNRGRGLVVLASAALAMFLLAFPARAHVCCECQSASVTASPGQVALNAPVTISYTARYCKCCISQAACNRTYGGCTLPSVNIQILLEGVGIVHQETVDMPITCDSPISRTPYSFQYTPTMAGVYTVVAGSPCPESTAQFTAGCKQDCDGIIELLDGTSSEDACPDCSTQDLPTPQVKIFKTKQGNIVRTLCAATGNCDDGASFGETVDGQVTAMGGGATPDYILARATYSDSSGNAVKAYFGGADAGGSAATHEEWQCIPWTGQLDFSVRGFRGEGSVDLEFQFWKLDMEGDPGAETICWKHSGFQSHSMQAKPNEQCHCCTGCVFGCGGTRKCNKVGSGTVGGTGVSVYAGGEPFANASVTPMENGDILLQLEGCPEAVIATPWPGYMTGFSFGGGFRDERVLLTDVRDGTTWEFGPVGAEFRLVQITNSDNSVRSTYQYDGQGRVSRVYDGLNTSDDYFSVTYQPDGKLDTITPTVDSVAYPDRAMTILYDGENVRGVTNSSCASCGSDARQYYYDTNGNLIRVTNANGDDLELYTYDAQDRLLTHQRLNDMNSMVTVQTRTYSVDPVPGVALSIEYREPVSAALERVYVEYLDEGNRVIQVDRYEELVSIGANPSGPSLTTTHSYDRVRDEIGGFETETTIETDPSGVSHVNVTKTFDQGLPVFLRDEGGKILPPEAFSTQGMQPGNATFTPQFQGAAAVARLEPASAGTYVPWLELRTATTINPGDRVCAEITVDGGTGGFAPAYVRLDETAAPGSAWFAPFTSCANYGVPGNEHGGWSLDSGETYTLTVRFTELIPQPNPADGWGLDSVAIDGAMGDPSGFFFAPYQAAAGEARYQWSYDVGTDGSVASSTISFSEYNIAIAAYLPLFSISEYGGQTDYTHDGDGLLVHQQDPAVTLLNNGGVARGESTYQYDLRKRLVRSGRTASEDELVYTDYAYDSFGHIITQTENATAPDPADRPVTTYSYDAFGNQTRTTDPRGSISERSYDAANRIEDSVVFEGAAGGPVLSQTVYEYDADGQLARTRVAVHDGPFARNAPDAWADTDSTYDLFGRRLTESNPGPGGTPLATAMHYDYQGQLIRQTEPDGSMSQFVYDGLGRLRQQIRSGPGVAALATQHVYNADGQLDAMIEPSGRTTTYGYDALGRLNRTTIVGVSESQVEYNDAGDVVRTLLIDLNASEALADTTEQYDELGRNTVTRRRVVMGADSADDIVELTVYDAAGRLMASILKYNGNVDVTAAEPGDRVGSRAYDVLGRAVSSTDAAGTVTTYSYDPGGELLSQTVDPGGLALTTTFVRDALTRPTQVTDPEGHYQTIAYDSRSNILRQSSFASDATPLLQSRMAYDLGGRQVLIVQMLDPASAAAHTPGVDAVTEQTWIAAGAPGAGQIGATTVYDAAGGRTTTFVYDGIGRQLRIDAALDPAQNHDAFEYDGLTGRLTARVNSTPLGQMRTELEYDAGDRIMSQRIVGGGGEPDLVTLFAYDGANRIVSVIHPDTTEMNSGYDLLGRMVSQVEDATGLARQTLREYDRHSNLVAIVANDGTDDQRTEYEYDAAGRNTLTRYPDHGLGGESGEVTQAYDAASRLAQRTDQRGIVTQFEYDGRGLMTRKLAASAGVEDRYTYDGAGRMLSYTRDTQNAGTRSWNGLNQLVGETQTVAGETRTVAFGHNPIGERTALTYPADCGTALTYTYDALGNNVTIARNGDPLVEYTAAGRLLLNRRLTTDQGVQIDTSYGYDFHRRVTQIDNLIDAAPVASYTFDHNVMGSPIQRLSASTRMPTWSTGYAYDALQRLTQTDYVDGTTGSEHFDYDLLGNRTRYCPRECDYGEPAEGSFYDHNVVNEYTQITDNGAPAVLRHDAAGNLASDDRGVGYVHDFENRLAAVFDDVDADGVLDPNEATLASFTYDALGRRTVKTAGGATTLHFYDGENEIAEYDAAAPSSPLRWVVNGTRYVDERAVVYTNAPQIGGPGTDDFYYLLGNLFSVAGVVSETGGIVEAVEYDSYGGVHSFRLVGDTDLDGDVDSDDVAAFLVCMSGPTALGGWTPPSLACLLAFDSDGDGDLDMHDLQRLQVAFSGVGDPSDSTPRSYAPTAAGLIQPYYFTGARSETYGLNATLQHNRARAYSARLGRFVERDPLGYVDGLELYSYVVERPTSNVDPMGTDFIAVADRAVKGTLGAGYHYSAEYWQCACPFSPLGHSKGFTEEEIRRRCKPRGAQGKANQCQKLGSVELLARTDWTVWAGTTTYFCWSPPCRVWDDETVWIAEIVYSDSATKIMPLYDDADPAKVANKWNKMIATAKSYAYGEQSGFSSGPTFTKWPGSLYKTFQTNSNTFVRHIVASAGIGMVEMSGAHPGNTTPSQNTQSGYTFYATQTPWPSGGTPKPKPPGTPP